jgi:hypothetical protein
MTDKNKVFFVAMVILIGVDCIKPHNQEENKIILIIGNPILNCHNCQLLLDDFKNSIKYSHLKKYLLGVYIPLENSDIGIQEKQILRYMKTNAYNFPLIIDYVKITRIFSLYEYDLILLFGKKIYKLKFPLNMNEWTMIRSIG